LLVPYSQVIVSYEFVLVKLVWRISQYKIRNYQTFHFLFTWRKISGNNDFSPEKNDSFILYVELYVIKLQDLFLTGWWKERRSQIPSMD